MTQWDKTAFAKILVESRDGEWGQTDEAVGYRLAEIIRGTDFSDLNNPNKELPKRWIKNHLIERKMLYPGDLILETAGGTAKQSTGRSALVRKSFFELHKKHPILCASFSRYLRIDKRKYCPEFIYYLLQTLYNTGYMAVYNLQHTGVSRFQYTVFKNKTTLKIPKIKTQEKIAAILSVYDDLTENNKRRIALLEKMAEEIYREWFVRMRFPGHEKEEFKKGVPDGWKKIKLEKAFKFTGGGTPSKKNERYWTDGRVNWFTPSDITSSDGIFLDRSSERCTDEGLSNSSARLFPAYSIMMTSRATIGAIGINTTSACTNQGFITCIPNEKYPLPFLYHWLKLSKPHFELLSGGATFAELTKTTFKRIEILTPPKELVSFFSDKTAPLLKAIEKVLQTNANLENMRDMLLQRLISGKLPVENLDIQFQPSMQNKQDVDHAQLHL